MYKNLNESSAMNGLKQKLQAFCIDQEGATAVEYALFAAAIAGVIVTIVISLGTAVNGTLEKGNTEFSKALSASGN